MLDFSHGPEWLIEATIPPYIRRFQNPFRWKRTFDNGRSIAQPNEIRWQLKLGPVIFWRTEIKPNRKGDLPGSKWVSFNENWVGQSVERKLCCFFALGEDFFLASIRFGDYEVIKMRVSLHCLGRRRLRTGMFGTSYLSRGICGCRPGGSRRLSTSTGYSATSAG